VWPLALSLDTVGPMARDLAGVLLGMQLLEPGFAACDEAATAIGRVRLAPEAGVDPAIDSAVDGALAAAGFEVVDVQLPGLRRAHDANITILIAEAWQSDGHLLERRDRLSDEVAVRIEFGRGVTAEVLRDAEDARAVWRRELDELFERVQLLALPTLTAFPPPLTGPDGPGTTLTAPFNLAGVPALSLPVPAAGTLPASLQLVGPRDGEELLVATGVVVEAAVG